ncbi:MAG: hypothetical protein K9M51_00190 [Candidatus Gracilibacteria bacterium]|nr:hypothetical protein [Candidatus Gracilibacteria bacterium]
MIEYSPEDFGLEYQTRKGEKFKAHPPDPEGLPLSEYRKKESEKINDFLDSEKEVCVVGGFSATGKTFFFKNLAKEKGFAFVDLQAFGFGTAEKWAEESIKKAEGGTIFDEGMMLEEDIEVQREFRKLFSFARGKKHKIFLLGGGTAATTEGQESFLLQQIPENSLTETVPFFLKILNEQQIIELLEATIKKFQGELRERLEKTLSCETKTKEAINQIHPYFRIARVISRLPYSDRVEGSPFASVGHSEEIGSKERERQRQKNLTKARAILRGEAK